MSEACQVHDTCPRDGHVRANAVSYVSGVFTVNRYADTFILRLWQVAFPFAMDRVDQPKPPRPCHAGVPHALGRQLSDVRHACPVPCPKRSNIRSHGVPRGIYCRRRLMDPKLTLLIRQSLLPSMPYMDCPPSPYTPTMGSPGGPYPSSRSLFYRSRGFEDAEFADKVRPSARFVGSSVC